MKKLMIGAAIAAIACGCITVNQNDGGNANRKPGVINDVVHTKFKVSNDTVSAQDSVYCLFGLFTWGSSASHIADAVCGEKVPLVPLPILVPASAKARNGAYANACDAAKCDQIMAAKYKVTTDDYFVFKKVKAEITGYPASVSGVEVIENNKIPNVGCCCK